MTDPQAPNGRTLEIALDAQTYTAVVSSAQERGIEPSALVERWVRERLAHESERGQGRERRQRPAE